MILAKKIGTDMKNPNHRKEAEPGENTTAATKRVIVAITLKRENNIGPVALLEQDIFENSVYDIPPHPFKA